MLFFFHSGRWFLSLLRPYFIASFYSIYISFAWKLSRYSQRNLFQLKLWHRKARLAQPTLTMIDIYWEKRKRATKLFYGPLRKPNRILCLYKQLICLIKFFIIWQQCSIIYRTGATRDYIIRCRNRFNAF